jgi:hypothetical protein
MRSLRRLKIARRQLDGNDGLRDRPMQLTRGRSDSGPSPPPGHFAGPGSPNLSYRATSARGNIDRGYKRRGYTSPERAIVFN